MLEQLIDFYRSVNRPELNNSLQFEITIIFSETLFQQLKHLSKQGFVQLDEMLISDLDTALSDIQSEHFGESATLSGKISTGDCQFYLDIQDLLQRNTGLSKGQLTTAFYVASDDYYSAGKIAETSSQIYQQLHALMLLIYELKDLAHYHDAKVGEETLNLVFVREIEGSNAKSLQITPKLTMQLLEAPVIDIATLVEIGQQAGVNPHIGREKSVFRSTLVEFLSNSVSNSQDKFAYLVLHWSEFIQLFKKNFDTYISGFAFHKARKEVADAEVAAADQLAKVLNDISGKALGIPLSLASLVLIAKTDSTFERLVLVCAALLASWLLAQLMYNQQLQLARIKDARALLFDEIKVRAADYPEELSSRILDTSRNLETNEKKVGRLLCSLRIISWLPALTATALLWHLNAENVRYSVSILNTFLMQFVAWFGY
ncbi:hypothetical protein [Rheinheimera tangshanensis]|uniref:Uncharacterized protein n=1 Tax=Rheinheimera tangshanensis TaxID=400153 RepID=A0A5C8M5U2_9GAMM|nr:hypothetical protein [Rheinheimera tangshanensis]TXK83298.1 hypothetical protein FU839_03225 [Rheinheimera tangshanensis]GGM44717.1 hypothetical protein GCM10010920_01220 [Rheinheimera tangshanensis]